MLLLPNITTFFPVKSILYFSNIFIIFSLFLPNAITLILLCVNEAYSNIVLIKVEPTKPVAPVTKIVLFLSSFKHKQFFIKKLISSSKYLSIIFFISFKNTFCNIVVFWSCNLYIITTCFNYI